MVDKARHILLDYLFFCEEKGDLERRSDVAVGVHDRCFDLSINSFTTKDVNQILPVLQEIFWVRLVIFSKHFFA